MRVCIDLDGVICQLRKDNESYKDLKPIDGAIERIKQLKNNGHYIIIHTARRMKTHSGNVPKVMADIGKVTLDWLESYNIPYDEILFGKPWANIYIDDNAFRFSTWSEIENDGSNLPIYNEDKVREKNITFVIPMAGEGSRFKKDGFKIPKYMVKSKQKTLFEHSIESLPIELADKLIFVCLKEHEKFLVSSFIKDRVVHNNIHIVLLNEVTKGQAETVYMAKQFINENDELLIYNIDTFFHSNRLREILLDNNIKKDGLLGAFIDKTKDEKWSFAKINKNKYVVQTAEKKKISDFALTGMYHFTRAGDFLNTAKTWIENGVMVKNEYYIAPMYNDLIKQGKQYVLDIADEFIPLGTPKDVKNFEERD